MRFDPLNTSTPYVSPDGTRVIFGALQQVAGTKHWHVIARNVRTNGFSRIDISPSGKLANGDVRVEGISADGVHVLFATSAANFGGRWETYERDMVTHRTILVTEPPSGQSQQWHGEALGLSRDGRLVVLRGNAPGTPSQIWLRDVVSQATVLVSRAADGKAGDGDSLAADVAPDGSRVVFASSSDNLVPNDTNKKQDVFLWTRATGAIQRISVASDGSQLAQGSSSPNFTTDGRHVVYASDAQLTADACKGGSDGVNDSYDGRNAYVLDLTSGALTHPKQNCNYSTANENVIVGSNGGATIAVGVHYEFDTVYVRNSSTERHPNLLYAMPTSITANGRYVGIDHYDPVDNPPHDPFAGALVWDLTHSQPAPAWLVRTTA